jgi:hypothetical protein
MDETSGARLPRFDEIREAIFGAIRIVTSIHRDWGA